METSLDRKRSSCGKGKREWEVNEEKNAGREREVPRPLSEGTNTPASGQSSKLGRESRDLSRKNTTCEEQGCDDSERRTSGVGRKKLWDLHQMRSFKEGGKENSQQGSKQQ